MMKMVKDRDGDKMKEIKVATYNVLKVAANPLFNVILKPQLRYQY